MVIRLPKELESSIRAEVLSGHFASESDLIAEAVRLLLHQRKTQQPTGASATGGDPGPGSIGAMRDAADELDEIVADAMRRRREDTWRDISVE